MENLQCAENFSSYHWPIGYNTRDFINKSYYVIVCEIHDTDDCYYVSHTADAKGMSGEGKTIEEALTELKNIMESVVEEDVDMGGIFPDSSSLEYNIKDYEELERYYIEDGINVVNKTIHKITICENSGYMKFME